VGVGRGAGTSVYTVVRPIEKGVLVESIGKDLAGGRSRRLYMIRDLAGTDLVLIEASGSEVARERAQCVRPLVPCVPRQYETVASRFRGGFCSVPVFYHGYFLMMQEFHASYADAEGDYDA
jgi:hypothetical protein